MGKLSWLFSYDENEGSCVELLGTLEVLEMLTNSEGFSLLPSNSLCDEDFLADFWGNSESLFDMDLVHLFVSLEGYC